jgi:hypothetical protein
MSSTAPEFNVTWQKHRGGGRVRALGDPCQWENTPPRRPGFVSDDGKHGHRIHVQISSRGGRYDNSGSEKSAVERRVV